MLYGLLMKTVPVACTESAGRAGLWRRGFFLQIFPQPTLPTGPYYVQNDRPRLTAGVSAVLPISLSSQAGVSQVEPEGLEPSTSSVRTKCSPV